MYRTILVGDPWRLQRVCALFDRMSHLGWWTKAIYVHSKQQYMMDDVVALDMEYSLTSLIRHCPNLQIFNADHPLASAHRSVFGTLRFYCARSLTSVYWRVPCDAQARIIAAIASMRNLASMNIHLTGPQYESDRTISGYGCLVNVALPHLHSLVLRGTIQDFSEELPSWDLPSLRTLVLDFSAVQHDLPDVLDVLSTHGPQLTTLDINSAIALDVPSVLAHCTELRTFCFNLDWRLDGVLTRTPHAHIERVGMYGLRYAFGAGAAGALANIHFIEATVLRNRNDLTFAALNRQNFPRLRRVRVLDPEILRGLNRSNGPARGGPAHCYERWERWWDMCTRMRVRLEDCTGELLGTLPMSEEDSDGHGDEDGEGEEWEEGEEEWPDAEMDYGSADTAAGEAADGNVPPVGGTSVGVSQDVNVYGGSSVSPPNPDGATRAPVTNDHGDYQPPSLVSVS